MRWMDGITDLMDMRLSKLWERVEDRGAWRDAVHGVATEATEHTAPCSEGDLGRLRTCHSLAPAWASLNLARALLLGPSDVFRQ